MRRFYLCFLLCCVFCLSMAAQQQQPGNPLEVVSSIRSVSTKTNGAWQVPTMQKGTYNIRVTNKDIVIGGVIALGNSVYGYYKVISGPQKSTKGQYSALVYKMHDTYGNPCTVMLETVRNEGASLTVLYSNKKFMYLIDGED